MSARLPEYGRKPCHRMAAMALFTGVGFATYFTPSGTRKGCRNANMGVVFSGGGKKRIYYPIFVFYGGEI